MIDRLVHHAEVVFLKGDFYRLKDPDRGRAPNRQHRVIKTRPTSLAMVLQFSSVDM